ncbi:phosphomannomutase/phosphoglucomutase [bacterium]|nr:phosphomannomutase/phosphoglucomutase [bacterium]
MNPGIFKAYDIRGIYPSQLDENTAYLIGGAYVRVIGAKKVAIGRDVRLSGEKLQQALIRGITDAGADVDLLGIITTDALYFAVGKFGYDGGIMITASHNPAEYNGFKMCKSSAIPLSGDSGLPEIKKMVKIGSFRISEKPGTIRKIDIIDDYITHCFSFVNVRNLMPFKIAVDAGNGVAGLVLPKVFEKLPFKVIELYFEPDGRFPNHLPSPIEPENTEELRKIVVDKKLDFGIAFDGDADRMFIVDDLGNLIGGDIVTAMVSQKMLCDFPGSSIVYNLICSKTVPETIEKYGGKPIRSRVGHAFIKPMMRKNDAIFGGEHSGHFYFKDNWFADSGLISFLIIAELLSQQNKKTSELIAEMDHYYRTGEINTRVIDRMKTLSAVANRVENETGAKPDSTDGITFDFDNWWFNLRPSNTEPLIRLNLEASTKELLDEKKQWVLNLIAEANNQ